MIQLKNIEILCSKAQLANIPDGKILINTINAHSYNTALKDKDFAEALKQGDVLLPDGISIVKACRWIKARCRPTERVAGWDLFAFEMNRLNALSAMNAAEGAGKNACKRKKVMFMGSSEQVLARIRKRARVEYPHLEVITYSPPYKAVFSEEDNRRIIDAINRADPDLLWIGMTAPKQEKWTHRHWHELHINCHVGTVGAVFDFFAGTVQRAPAAWQRCGLEWLYRLLKEPKRMWRRYLVGNALFLRNIAVHEWLSRR